MDFSGFKKFCAENKILLISFFITSLFFLIQQFFYIGWDFAAYSINADYLFWGGDYFEVYRAPMISILIGAFGIFGSLSHYVYILFVSILFLFSVVKLSDSLFELYFKNKTKLDKNTFRAILYLLFSTPFFLIYGLTEGTELLSLSFLMLFLSSFISGKLYGHYLGLAFLSRYNFIIFSIFLFFNKDYKKIFKNIASFILVILPWSIFNFIKWGNFFTSLIDSIYLNVISRQGMIEAFKWTSLIHPINYLLPIFLIGLVAFLCGKKNRINLIFLFILIAFIWEIYTVPFKVIRYMFNLILPISFFSLIGYNSLIEKCPKIKNIIMYLLLILLIISSAYIVNIDYKNRSSGKIYNDVATAIKENGYENCVTLSNVWVPINYYSKNTYFLGDVNESIDSNKIVIVIRGFTTIDDKFTIEELENYNTIYNETRFFFIAKDGLNNETCEKRFAWDRPMLSDPCESISELFKKIKLNKLIKQMCLMLSRNEN